MVEGVGRVGSSVQDENLEKIRGQILGKIRRIYTCFEAPASSAFWMTSRNRPTDNGY